jgi:hypothetical protein
MRNHRMSYMPFKKRILKLLFFAYFVVYAVSPLTYTIPGHNLREPCYSNRGQVSGEKGLHLMLWDLLFKGVASPHAASEKQEQGTILIRKTRALLPEDDTAKTLSYEQASVVNSCSVPRMSMSFRYIDHSVFLGMRRGFNTLYAGHSPPFFV